MRRVFGLETEYGFFCRVNGSRLPSRENVIRYVLEQTVPGPRNGNGFLENGGRLDSGFHPEYATPEADQVSDLVAHDKAGERIRDEALADPHRYRRLHLILGDSNMSEVTTYLKVGTTALVIDMIEDGCLNGDYSLDGSVAALRTVSRDPTLRATVKAKDGRVLTALEIQSEYLERAIRYVQSSGSDPEQRDILSRWMRAIERLEREPLLLDREVDWAIKLRWMTRLMDRSGISWNDPRVSLLDLQYHDMRPDRSVYHHLAALGMVERITNDVAVERAMTTPPQTTRARLRGECIRRLRLSGKDYRADWGSLKVLGEEAPTPTVHWRDPLQAHDEDTERLIDTFSSEAGP